MGDNALTGTKKLTREDSHWSHCCASPPPGTMSWRWGGDWSCLTHVDRMPGKPGKSVPMQRAPLATRVWASEEALHRAW